MPVPTIDLLSPHAIPKWDAMHARFPRTGPAPAEPGGSLPWVLERLQTIRGVLPATDEASIETPESIEDRAHDAYFHVRRTNADAVETFARLALDTRVVLLQDIDEAPAVRSLELIGLIDVALADFATNLPGGH